MARGQERFNIFCAPCHGRVGDGNGIVAQRGFCCVSSLLQERLRDAPPGYFFDVITNGIGTMPSYGFQVPERDRWAIIAYVRALQLSQNATLEDVPAEERDALSGGTPVP
jgi:mono/diheme cytochrome c family protein